MDKERTVGLFGFSEDSISLAGSSIRQGKVIWSFTKGNLTAAVYAVKGQPPDLLILKEAGLAEAFNSHGLYMRQTAIQIEEVLFKLGSEEEECIFQ